MTLAELRARVATLIGEDSSDYEHYSSAEVDRYINDAYRSIARNSGALEHIYLTSPTAGVGEYTLPSFADRIFRVAFDQEKIFPTTVHELDRFDEDWEGETGTPQFYTLDQLDKQTVRLYRKPDTTSGAFFDAELGTVIDTNHSSATEEFRFESDDVSLGTVVDYVQGSDTTVFAIAASGGGSDADYGIVVDISSDDGSSTYTFPTSELGTMVNIDDTSSLAYDTERFIATRAGTAGHDTRDTELGITVDIDRVSGDNKYVFTDDEGNPLDTALFNQETGTVIDATEATFLSEFGTTVDYEDAMFSSEFGIVVRLDEPELGVVIDIDGFDDGLEVWFKKDPDDIDVNESPELPEYAHQAIAYEAAARALRKRSEVANPELAQVYAAIADEQTKFLKFLSANRTPEKTHRMREFRTTRSLKRFARLPSTYPRLF